MSLMRHSTVNASFQLHVRPLPEFSAEHADSALKDVGRVAMFPVCLRTADSVLVLNTVHVLGGADVFDREA
jgi:hypothetical protein